MLNVLDIRKEPILLRNHRREKKLWHDGSRHTSSFGCTECHDRDACGGLRIESAFYDCLNNCCHQPEKCDAVCRNKPMEFVQRVREISGFQLENVPRAARLPERSMPSVVPVLYHGNSRDRAFAPPVVCLSLYSVILRNDGREGIVRLTLRPAQCRDEHLPAPLPSASLSARHHQPCRLALPQVLPELPGC